MSQQKSGRHSWPWYCVLELLYGSLGSPANHHTDNLSFFPPTAIISVYDKTGLLDLAKGLVKQNVRLLASGGTSKMIREAGFPVE